MIYYVQHRSGDLWITLEMEGVFTTLSTAQARADQVHDRGGTKQVRVLEVSAAWYPPGEPAWKREEM